MRVREGSVPRDRSVHVFRINAATMADIRGDSLEPPAATAAGVGGGAATHGATHRRVVACFADDAAAVAAAAAAAAAARCGCGCAAAAHMLWLGEFKCPCFVLLFWEELSL